MVLDVGVGMRDRLAGTLVALQPIYFRAFNLISTYASNWRFIAFVSGSIDLADPATLSHARKHATHISRGLVGERLALALVRMPVCALTRGIAIVYEAAPIALGERANRRLDGRACGAHARRERDLEYDEENTHLFMECGARGGTSSGGEFAELVGELGVLRHARLSVIQLDGQRELRLGESLISRELPQVHGAANVFLNSLAMQSPDRTVRLHALDCRSAPLH